MSFEQLPWLFQLGVAFVHLLAMAPIVATLMRDRAPGAVPRLRRRSAGDERHPLAGSWNCGAIRRGSSLAGGWEAGAAFATLGLAVFVLPASLAVRSSARARVFAAPSGPASLVLWALEFGEHHCSAWGTYLVFSGHLLSSPTKWLDVLAVCLPRLFA